MLKFFRTIRKKLIEEENVRKYLLYAIGEVLLVVIGILIALQVNNWNEERKDKAKAQVYYERLSRDIDRDSALLQRAVTTVEKWAGYAVTAMEGLGNDAVVTRDPCLFLASLSQPAQSFYPVLYRHTFNEIVSSGHLGLIESEQLKDELSQYYTAHESYQQWMDGYRQINLDYGKATAGILPRDLLQKVKAFEDGGACQIDVAEALAVKKQFLGREGLRDWLPRLEIRQKALAERLQRTIITNQKLGQMINQERRYP